MQAIAIPTTCRDHAAVSPVSSFNFQSTKEGSETKVGNAMNLEGGVGGDFLGGRLAAGLAYYASGAEFNIVATFLVKPLKLGKP